MSEKLINITAPQHRCTFGGCPAVLKSDDGNTLTIIGKSGDPRDLPEGVAVGDHEEIVEIPAEVVLSALGVTELIEAAEPILRHLALDENQHQELYEERLEDNASVLVPAGRLRALRSAIYRIGGNDA
jgi:hypothetical protein